MKFIHESGIYVPLNQSFFSLQNGKMALPITSNDLSDVETRSIDGAPTALSGEIIFQAASGFLIMASGNSWIGFTLV